MLLICLSTVFIVLFWSRYVGRLIFLFFVRQLFFLVEAEIIPIFFILFFFKLHFVHIELFFHFEYLFLFSPWYLGWLFLELRHGRNLILIGHRLSAIYRGERFFWRLSCAVGNVFIHFLLPSSIHSWLIFYHFLQLLVILLSRIIQLLQLLL